MPIVITSTASSGFAIVHAPLVGRPAIHADAARRLDVGCSPVVIHKWYARPVFYVADVHRAARFYIERLGFAKAWHEGDGAGTVCQVNHGECEIILCQDATRTDKARLFIELTPEGLADLRRELAERSVPNKETWWGYDAIQVDDPDGNELLFPIPA